MRPKFGTQVNWNPSHFVPSIPSPLNRAQQQEREQSKIQIQTTSGGYRIFMYRDVQLDVTPEMEVFYVYAV